ncbi:fructose-bisphosphate aldolase class II [Mycoplasma testudineum]|uniref:Fructose-bisphosphate aldolase class II n=1 Tax=Mycoplasma testudineum TaxID=244584 RepID=A0A4R6IEV0_9MOLU|nr:class II fructose-1,6-bisphosphate aldolase [Mycoplasma testudineum]OYD26967.1 fructose-1,6-bisphosphate aldolase, class II [Mycoplasma testudineum]TDO20514.1 fructose-bisphosphate aldolase class II [Mycoplasma testudineum]
MSKLVSASNMLKKAEQNKYAVPHININNLEWAKAALMAAEKNKSPIMLATSLGAVKYMGGMKTVSALVSALMDDLKITVPVALHLDHATKVEEVKLAMEVGYTSVMYDGSHSPFEENVKNVKELLAIAKSKGVSFEAEVGTIGGEEDGIVGNGDLADPAEAKIMVDLGIDVLACGIGNIHGPYPKEWKSLNFDRLTLLKKAIGNRGIVLHGGSGIPTDQIKKAISLGVTKINVNTELQLANAAAIKDFVISGKIDEGKNFDPRKIYAGGIEAIINTVSEKMSEFGSVDKA